MPSVAKALAELAACGQLVGSSGLSWLLALIDSCCWWHACWMTTWPVGARARVMSPHAHASLAHIVPTPLVLAV